MTQPPPAAATERAPVGLVLLWLLALLAGAVDARGIVLLNDIFLSFMSGNSTMLAVNLARADWAKARLIGLIVGVFVLGAAAGQAVAEVSGRWRLSVVVAVVTVLLTASLAAPLLPPLLVAPPILRPATLPILMLTFAMGALNAAMAHAGAVTVSITFVTGALVRFGQGLGALLVGRSSGFLWLAQVVPWSGLVAGAILGTLASREPRASFDLVLPLYACALTILTAVATWRAG